MLQPDKAQTYHTLYSFPECDWLSWAHVFVIFPLLVILSPTASSYLTYKAQFKCYLLHEVFSIPHTTPLTYPTHSMAVSPSVGPYAAF